MALDTYDCLTVQSREELDLPSPYVDNPQKPRKMSKTNRPKPCNKAL